MATFLEDRFDTICKFGNKQNHLTASHDGSSVKGYTYYRIIGQNALMGNILSDALSHTIRKGAKHTLGHIFPFQEYC